MTIDGTQTIGPAYEYAARTTLRGIVEQAGMAEESASVAILPRRIKSANKETHFYGNRGPIQLAEVYARQRTNGQFVRMYLDPIQNPEGSKHIPVICLGPIELVGRMAAHENLPIFPYEGHILVDGTEDEVVDHDSLQQLRGVGQVLRQPRLVYAQRRSSFRLTGISSCTVNGQASVVKHYDKLVDETGEYFTHVLSHGETAPLVEQSDVGEIAGVCITNSPWYQAQHPELHFINIQD